MNRGGPTVADGLQLILSPISQFEAVFICDGGSEHILWSAHFSHRIRCQTFRQGSEISAFYHSSCDWEGGGCSWLGEGRRAQLGSSFMLGLEAGVEGLRFPHLNLPILFSFSSSPSSSIDAGLWWMSPLLPHRLILTSDDLFLPSQHPPLIIITMLSLICLLVTQVFAC